MITVEISGSGKRGRNREVILAATALSQYILDALADKARQMADYVLNHADHAEVGEKVEYFGHRNLAGEESGTWPEQMAASALAGRSTNDPLAHWVVSWPSRVRPAKAEVEQMIDLFLEELGARGLHCVWSVHSNTQNWHSHILLSRIDPLTHRARLIGEGWQKDAAQRFNALAADRFGWELQPNALYRIEDGQLRRRDKDGRMQPMDRADPSPRKGERAREQSRLRAEFQVVALRDAILKSSGWRDMHRCLEERGASYRKSGSGAVIILADGRQRKASEIDRQCARPALERRWGAFVPAPDEPTHDPDYSRYKQTLENQESRLRRQEASALAHLARLDRLNFDVSAERMAVKRAIREAKRELRHRRLAEQQWKAAGMPDCPAVEPVEFILTRPESGTARNERWPVRHRDGRVVIFEEYRDLIIVRSLDEAHVRRSIELAASKWSAFEPIGSPEFCKQVYRIAQELGMGVSSDGICRRREAGPLPARPSVFPEADKREQSRPAAPPGPARRANENQPPRILAHDLMRSAAMEAAARARPQPAVPRTAVEAHSSPEPTEKARDDPPRIMTEDAQRAEAVGQRQRAEWARRNSRGR